jgi:hypothetical protein
MLIRLAGHFKNNPHHIDKLICIKGLPEEWVFKPSRWLPGGKELIKPWIPDVEANIPGAIRHLCDPVEIAEYAPPIQPGVAGITDTKTILGIKLHFDTQPAYDIWEKIERWLERITPRDQKVPEPVLVAKDHKGDGISAFSPHIGRRNSRGVIEVMPAEIPVVEFVKEPLAPPPMSQEQIALEIKKLQGQLNVSTAPVEEPKETFPICPQCQKKFNNERGLNTHVRIAHKGNQVTAGV